MNGWILPTYCKSWEESPKVNCHPLSCYSALNNCLSEMRELHYSKLNYSVSWLQILNDYEVKKNMNEHFWTKVK